MSFVTEHLERRGVDYEVAQHTRVAAREIAHRLLAAAEPAPAHSDSGSPNAASSSRSRNA